MVRSILLALLLTACTSPTDATRALQSAGYTQISTGGFNVFACSQYDFYHTSFSATNVLGKRVSGTVCSGLLFKSATVRF